MFFLAKLLVASAVLPALAYAATFDVQVGGANGSLTFEPEAIYAAAGDQVTFHFNPKNHTVSQSSFANPCGLKEGGFDSGFEPVSADMEESERPTYTITVNDTNPIWVYCRQKSPANHCGKGMVFAVNCPADGPNSFTNFKNAALAFGASLEAGAAATSAAASATTYTAAFNASITLPPAVAPSVVTETVTVEQSTWTTTYSSYYGSPKATPVSLQGAVHKVVVGANGTLAFDPPFVAAAPRDTIVFEFQSKNHSVVQSSFDNPCSKLAKDDVSGFSSGFMPVSNDTTSFPTFNVTVNDTAPIWVYCSQKSPADHCTAGMVMAINSDESSERDFAAFQALAKQTNATSAASNSDAATTGDDNGAARLPFAGALSMLSVVLGLFAVGL
ncbi:Cupredoxin [Schizophyllum fasciatum]